MNFLLLQVIAFSDEEGVRFHSTFLGSAALAGVLPLTALQISDKRFPWINLSLYLLMILFIISLFMHNPFFSGVTVQDALKENSLEITEENLLQLKYDPGSVWGYIEV